MKTRDKLKLKSLQSQWIGKTYRKQEDAKSQAYKHILLKIHVSIYLCESITWIPIQIIYVDRHFRPFPLVVVKW